MIHFNLRQAFWLLTICLISTSAGYAQRSAMVDTIKWKGVTTYDIAPGLQVSQLNFDDAAYHAEHSNPVYIYQQEVVGHPARANATLNNTRFESLSAEELAAVNVDFIDDDISITAYISVSRGQAFATAEFIPLRINTNGGVERLVEFELNLTVSGSVSTPPRTARTTSSVMASGEWHKIGVANSGMYRISYDYLKNIGVDVESISPNQINIYGNGFGLLPMANSVSRPDDLQANAIRIVGGEDGSFDPDDYILFFANGPHKWEYNQNNEEFRHIRHHYSDSSYYFIAVDAGAPKRISSTSSTIASPTHTVNTFDDYMFHELELVNLIKTGRTWYGESFDVQNTHTFSGDRFNFPNISTTDEAKFRVDLMSRSIPGSVSSSFAITVNNTESFNVNINGVSGIYTDIYARGKAEVRSFYPTSPNFNVEIQYNPASASSKGWLNYISINVRRQLMMHGNQMMFRDIRSVGPGNVAEFQIENASSIQVWEVSDPVNATEISLSPDGTFRRPASELREFIAFSGSNFPAPTYFGSVSNQNLHALGVNQPIDMIVVAHPRFYAEAMDLANFHTTHPIDPVYTEVVTNQQVYNEFSSGTPDITAIKDLMRMLYDRAGGDESLMPKYLLLFGDGSYDNRSRSANNTNFVLTYQSSISNSPTQSYVSDDYFGLLDFNEGESVSDKVDIGIGRLPVKSREEAQGVLRKIKQYMTTDFSAEVAHCSGVGSSAFGEWRNRLVFVADDEDNNRHMIDSDELTEISYLEEPDFNITKIMMDAYQQESTPGGNRYPEVNKLFRENVERGALILNYMGHGGEIGLAHERILDISTIRNWTNINSLPLFVTATCEFTRFDDPSRTSAGEYVLLNPNGGGIALLSTTRLVYTSPNMEISRNFYRNVFKHNEVPDLRLGDITRRTKVATSGTVNKRSFMLIGDPAVRLVYPQKKVYTTAITDTLGNPLDTLKALGNVKISGYVGEGNGTPLSNFNGVVTVTVFDKASNITTLANDGGMPFHFSTHKNVLYRGKAAVTSGQFEISFIIPKDINLAVDTTGRISYYAVSDMTDAHGHAGGITIGSIDENAAPDDDGPMVELYMNDENFVFGGLTDENPVIYARLTDESGINMVGTGIGHDITATLNEQTSDVLILNDYYESDMDTYKSGTVRYQLESMEEGVHKLRLKAWDVHNNSGESYTEFVVAESEDFVLSHILNYPNPFTTHTEFSFEHNQVCSFLNVQIQVFTISGKLVKTISTVSQTNGFRVEPIAWNGLDDYGDQLARGVYVYKVKVRNPAGEKAEEFEKLVILK